MFNFINNDVLGQLERFFALNVSIYSYEKRSSQIFHFQRQEFQNLELTI